MPICKTLLIYNIKLFFCSLLYITETKKKGKFMLVNFNVQRPQQNFGMAIKFNKNASEYLQNRASKKNIS